MSFYDAATAGTKQRFFGMISDMIFFRSISLMGVGWFFTRVARVFRLKMQVRCDRSKVRAPSLVACAQRRRCPAVVAGGVSQTRQLAPSTGLLAVCSFAGRRAFDSAASPTSSPLPALPALHF